MKKRCVKLEKHEQQLLTKNRRLQSTIHKLQSELSQRKHGVSPSENRVNDLRDIRMSPTKTEGPSNSTCTVGELSLIESDEKQKITKLTRSADGKLKCRYKEEQVNERSNSKLLSADNNNDDKNLSSTEDINCFVVNTLNSCSPAVSSQPNIIVPETVTDDIFTISDGTEKNAVDTENGDASPIFTRSVTVSSSPSLFDDDDDRRRNMRLSLSVANNVHLQQLSTQSESMKQNVTNEVNDDCLARDGLQMNSSYNCVQDKCSHSTEADAAQIQNMSVPCIHVGVSAARKRRLIDPDETVCACQLNEEQLITNSASAAVDDDINDVTSAHVTTTVTVHQANTIHSHLDHDENQFLIPDPKSQDIDEENRSHDSFNRAPKSVDVNYKYIEVVRKQHQRRQLNGFACIQCQQWFEGMNLTDEEQAERLKHCRHKAKFEPSSTPDHYWSVSFPTTQQYKQQPVASDKTSEPARCRRKKGLRQLFNSDQQTPNNQHRNDMHDIQ